MEYEEWEKELKKRSDLTQTTFRQMPAYLLPEQERLFCYPAPFIQQLKQKIPSIQLDSVEYEIRKKIGEDSLEEICCYVHQTDTWYTFIYEMRHTPTESRRQHYVRPNSDKDQRFIKEFQSLLESFIRDHGYNRMSSLFQ